jgi:hypothetical protein
MRYRIKIYLKRNTWWEFIDMPEAVELTDKDLVLVDSDGKYFIDRSSIEMVECTEWVPPAPKPVVEETADAPRKPWYKRIFGGR